MKRVCIHLSSVFKRNTLENKHKSFFLFLCIAVYLIKLFQSSPLLDFLFVLSSHQFPRFCNLQIYNANKHHFVRFLYKVYVYFDDVFLNAFWKGDISLFLSTKCRHVSCQSVDAMQNFLFKIFFLLVFSAHKIFILFCSFNGKKRPFKYSYSYHWWNMVLFGEVDISLCNRAK